MKLNSAYPVAALRGYVRCFRQREAQITGAALLYPIAARPEQILEFYLQDRYLVRACGSGVQDFAPRALVVGPCTYRRAELVLRGRFEVFTIHFQPSGFHRLFRVPMPELVDHAYEARSVVGPFASAIEQPLAATADFAERIDIATHFLLQHVTAPNARDPVAAAAQQILIDRRAHRIGDIAASAGLSLRRFERKFRDQVGVAPKRYAAIVRFQTALRAKLAARHRSWTDIAPIPPRISVASL